LRPPEGLIGSKSRPLRPTIEYGNGYSDSPETAGLHRAPRTLDFPVASICLPAVDPIILLSVVMLIVWAAGTWFEAPGWIHLLLTVGVFLLVWRIVTKKKV
jgi:hypothetical protein